MRKPPAWIFSSLVLLSSPLGWTWANPEDETAGRSVPAPAEVSQQIDELVRAAWTEAGIKPAPAASDSEFLRRVSLDLTGSIPPEALTREFLASQGPKKRSRAIDGLLQEPSYARSMALRWAYLLVGRDYLFKSLNLRRLMQARDDAMAPGEMDPTASEPDRPVPPLVDWLEQKLEKNTPWDQLARELLTARGRSDENPAVHYLLRFRKGKQSAEEITGNVVGVFQGIQLQCAQCHDHPYTDWTQQDFYGVAAFFTRLAARPIKGENGKKRIAFEVFDRPNGQIRVPAPEGQTGRMVLPRFLGGKVVNPGGGVDRRAELASLITGADNPYFARATVNRVWSFYFGRGLFSPVDDLELPTEKPLPGVMELLEHDFRQSGYDMRRLSQVIMSTQVYQLSSGGPEEGRLEQQAVFAQASLRSLSAEQLFYSVLEASGTEDVRPTLPRQRRRLMRVKFQLLRKFLQTFGDDEQTEQVEEGTIPQALLLLNGPLTNDAVRPRPGHPLYDELFRLESAAARVEKIYLRVLSRRPQPQELKVALQLVESPQAKRAAGQAQAYADLVWALLNSSEFVFNH